jgi:hypothetical protein
MSSALNTFGLVSVPPGLMVTFTASSIGSLKGTSIPTKPITDRSDATAAMARLTSRFVAPLLLRAILRSFGRCPVLHGRSWVGEPAHEPRDCSRGHRIGEGLPVGRRRHDSKAIDEHAASSRRVIDALVRRLPRDGTGRQESTDSLCALTRGMSRLIVAELARRLATNFSSLGPLRAFRCALCQPHRHTLSRRVARENDDGVKWTPYFLRSAVQLRITVSAGRVG